MATTTNISTTSSYLTKDGSSIKELLHPTVHSAVRNQVRASPLFFLEAALFLFNEFLGGHMEMQDDLFLSLG
jgi:hypothetical protein